MAAIAVSPLVFRRLREEKISAETILRAALNIKSEGFTASDGTHFPEGTAFVAWYKERALSAIVRDGKIVCDGKPYSSLSAAAAHFTGRATTNGWTFWFHKVQGGTAFLPIKRAVKAAA